MQRRVLVTGSTDGIGLAAARLLVGQGHHVVLHGRDPAKLSRAQETLADLPGEGRVDGHIADLSRLGEVERLADAVAADGSLDALVNNAGVLNAAQPVTPDGLDVRFVVNTIAPYLLARRLLDRLGPAGRVVNVSSAAQAPVDPQALAGRRGPLPDGDAYAQSKLALTMWTVALAHELASGPAIVAVNPGSMLGTKMVREGFGVAGREVSIGAEILARAAVAEEFQAASGRYFDNDTGRFAAPHPDARDLGRCQRVLADIEAVLAAR